MRPKEERPFEIEDLFNEDEHQKILDYLLKGVLPPDKANSAEEEIDLPAPLEAAPSDKTVDTVLKKPSAVSLSIQSNGESTLTVNGEDVSQTSEYANAEPGTVVTHTLPEKSVFLVGTLLKDVVFSDLVLPGEWEVTEIHPGENGKRQVSFTKKG